MGRSGVPHTGHASGMRHSTRGTVSSGAAGAGPTISGMTSPALRSTTMSPMRTPFALTTSWLCSVARATVLPETKTGSSTAKGVARPVRPMPTWMSSSRVLTSSGGYL